MELRRMDHKILDHSHEAIGQWAPQEEVWLVVDLNETKPNSIPNDETRDVELLCHSVEHVSGYRTHNTTISLTIKHRRADAQALRLSQVERIASETLNHLGMAYVKQNSLPSLSILPNEILTQILDQGFGSEFDLVYLWSTLRNVSHRFRQVIESLVARTHLKKTYLTYIFRFAHLNSARPEDDQRVKFWLSFKEILPGSSNVAVFTPDAELNGTTQNAEWLGVVQQLVEEGDRDGFVRPAHMLSVIRYVNDTRLSGFQICNSKAEGEPWEVRLEWKQTISNLILEERLRQCLSRRFMREQRARSAGLSEKPLHDLHHAMKLHLLAHRMMRDESFHFARQKRITAQYKSAGVDFVQKVRGNRQQALAMRRKAEELEDHQSFMNQFSFS